MALPRMARITDTVCSETSSVKRQKRGGRIAQMLPSQGDDALSTCQIWSAELSGFPNYQFSAVSVHHSRSPPRHLWALLFIYLLFTSCLRSEGLQTSMGAFHLYLQHWCFRKTSITCSRHLNSMLSCCLV